MVSQTCPGGGNAGNGVKSFLLSFPLRKVSKYFPRYLVQGALGSSSANGSRKPCSPWHSEPRKELGVRGGRLRVVIGGFLKGCQAVQDRQQPVVM